jgi:hypothetical protein
LRSQLHEKLLHGLFLLSSQRHGRLAAFIKCASAIIIWEITVWPYVGGAPNHGGMRQRLQGRYGHTFARREQCQEVLAAFAFTAWLARLAWASYNNDE